ncbi:hypothetical protein [Amycolatopsis alkalitolerans]|uniref:N-acetyltransferase domain-containing protein n=1 Tax=Amycolatopsis alkalitolerans TaxID=2547244 RepID=A0A5C4M4G5_9PSEU|nr:hypothetical protein [Amycolatopsis alkalitolerans]TNC27459.1 hypothetical protein FG385_10390 [Amycolatopsis alkalitolerans]
MLTELSRAERALHLRAVLACEAAAGAGLGSFRNFEQRGLMAVSVSEPTLSFLATVSGVVEGNVADAIDLVEAPIWSGVGPTLIVSRPSGRLDTLLRHAGFTRVEDRLVAIKRLGCGPASWHIGNRLEVVDAQDDDEFADILLAGYQVDGMTADFIGAEHRASAVKKFLVRDRADLIAAGAMTLHGEVAVLGGASTLEDRRGRGAQRRLLRHRLEAATGSGCALAVATAGPESASATNLRRAGFRLARRPAWKTKSKDPASGQCG